MIKYCEQYQELLHRLLVEGQWREDPNRKGTKRFQMPFNTMVVDLREGFPMLTTKKLWWKGIVTETLWLLRGSSDVRELWKDGLYIWDKDFHNYYSNKCSSPYSLKELKNKQNDPMFAKNVFSIGRMYGVQWRSWRAYCNHHKSSVYLDQLAHRIKRIKDLPLASDHFIMGDNPADRDEQALPCCMTGMQFSCEPRGTDKIEQHFIDKLNEPQHYLDLSINYRSHDVILGYPWNVAQYALILEIIAKITNKTPRYLRINSQNIHFYDNQYEAVMENVKRFPDKYDLPKLEISPIALTNLEHKGLDAMLDECDFNSFKLKDYKSYPKLENQPEMKAYE